MKQETKVKISKALKGRKQTDQSVENRANALRGKKRTPEQKKRMSEARLRLKIKLSPEEIARRTETRRKNGWHKDIERTKRLMSENNAYARTGIKELEETRIKKSLALKGERNPNWQGGKEPINNRVRKSLEYQLWRKKVLERDNFTCQNPKCKKRGGKLHADHIKPFALYPELRFVLENGRTLCIPCHHKTETYGYRKMYRNV